VIKILFVVCFFSLFSSQVFAEKKFSFECAGAEGGLSVLVEITETDRVVKKFKTDVKVYQAIFSNLDDTTVTEKVDILMPFLDRATADLSFDDQIVFNKSDSYLDGLYAKGRRRLRFSTASGTLVWMTNGKNIIRQISGCDYKYAGLTKFFGLKLLSKAAAKKYLLRNVAKDDSIGFDIDDTLLLSSGNFKQATVKARELGIRPGGHVWWEWVNSGDEEHSKKKKSALSTLRMLVKERSTSTYLITARREVSPKPLRDYMGSLIPSLAEEAIFAPEGKTESIVERDIRFYFGDADSDIIDAQKAGATAIRVLRSSDSNASSSKYHPGWFGERILLGSED